MMCSPKPSSRRSGLLVEELSLDTADIALFPNLGLDTIRIYLDVILRLLYRDAVVCIPYLGG